MSKVFTLGLVVGLGLAAAARAQPVQGLYLGAGASWDAKQIEPLAPVPAFGIGSSERLRFDAGGAGGQASLGYGIGYGVRLEMEGSYRQDGIRMFATTVPGTGRSTQQDYGLMANALYDIDLRFVGVSFMTPYLGAGLGVQWSHLNGLVTIRNNGIVSHIGGTDGGLAYQGIVGAAFPIASVPGLAFTAEYRFLGVTGETTVAGEAYAGRTRLLSPVSFTQNLTHSVIVGLRYAFD